MVLMTRDESTSSKRGRGRPRRVGTVKRSFRLRTEVDTRLTTSAKVLGVTKTERLEDLVLRHA